MQSEQIWSQRNTVNQFYCKPKSRWKHKNFFIIEELKETILDFSQGTVKVFWIYFTLIWYQYKMTQYNTSNLKSQLNKLKSGIKNDTEVTFFKCSWWF